MTVSTVNHELITRAEALPRIAEEIDRSPTLPLDTETTGLDPHTCHTRLLQLETHAGVRVIDLYQTGGPGPVLDALRVYDGIIVGQGLKFEQKFFLKHWKLKLNKVFDTYRGSAIVYNGRWKGKRREDTGLWLTPDYEPEWDTENNSHDLYALYERELGVRHQSKDLGASNWSNPLLTPEQIAYAAEDVVYLNRLRDSLRPKLLRDGLSRIAQIEFDAILPEAAMELNGFYLDQEAWLRLAERNARRERKLRELLQRVLPDPFGQTSLFEGVGFNLQSNPLLLRSLQRMGFPLVTTSEPELALYSDHPVIRLLIKWRGYAQCVKTFGKDYLTFVNPVTGRVHTSFFAFTGAGRYSSGNPNLQQIPHSAEFRRCFRAAPGKKLVIRDYSQIELRILGEIANDKALLDGYARGIDAHSMTASLLAGVPLEKVTKAQRQLAKPVNFGLAYKMMPPKLANYAKSQYGVDMSLAQAEEYSDRFFARYSGVRRWHDRVLDRAFRRRGESRTILGRRRYLGQYLDEETGKMRMPYNEFTNTPVQGSGADGLKASLRIHYDALEKYNGSAYGVHMVHDELVSECEADPELCRLVDKDVEEAMREGMAKVIKRVPIVTEGGVADTWAEK